MRILWLLVVTSLTLFLSAPVSAAALAIPTFTPNVVDPHGYLDAAATERVNAELLRIRDESHIWGAVYIVDTLGGEPIENVAVQAFEQWQLGEKGVDNGLLLVLAIDDRKSRFEVGYGLEGTITDVASLRALDSYLAPGMRAGNIEGAIVESFGFLSRLVAQDPGAVLELQMPDSAESTSIDDDMDWNRGLIAWGVFLVQLWLCIPLRNAWVGYRRRSLFEEHPVLALRGDEQVVKPQAATGGGAFRWGILLFLSINPGLFVFFLSAMEQLVYYGAVAFTALISLLVIFLPARKYGSVERYQQFLEKVAKERADLIAMGHLEQTTAGEYRYTAAYHASRASSSSSSSSSSGSSSSSSSGGGRSGGGGASSGW